MNLMEHASTNTDFAYYYTLYNDLGFLYGTKSDYINPILPDVAATWEKLLKSDNLFHITSVVDSNTNRVGLSSSWRATRGCKFLQHSISNDINYFLMALVEESTHIASDSNIRYVQTWVQPQRSEVNKICNILNHDNEACCFDHTFQYLVTNQVTAVRPDTIFDYQIRTIEQWDSRLAQLFERAHFDHMFIQAEELDSDICLRHIGQHYAVHGLQMGRQVYGLSYGDCLVAAILVYRASKGINFSMLENRVLVIIDPAARVDDLLYAKISELLGMLQPTGSSFPILTDSIAADAFVHFGRATKLREYRLCLWPIRVFTEGIDRVKARFKK